MALTVTIPTLLRNLTSNQESVQVEAKTVDEALNQLEKNFSGFRARIFVDNQKLHRFVNIYVDGEDIRFLKGLSTPVHEGSEVSIILAVAGG